MIRILFAVMLFTVTPAMAIDEDKLDRAIELMEKVVQSAEQGHFLTDITQSCPADSKPPVEGYVYSPDPETQEWCTANPCHCF